MSASKKPARLVGATGLLVGAGILFAGPAAAHVAVSPGSGHAGEYTVATLAVPHGCDGSPTTKVAIKVPEELYAITPTINPGWTVEKVMEKLATPVEDAHGNEITERVGQVVYTAKTPLPDGYRDAFELSFQVPDVAGTTIYFPAIQTCTKGEAAWVEIAEEGQEEPEHPAPAYRVLESTGGDGHGGAASDTAAEAGAGDGDDSDDGSDTLGVLGVVAGVLGLGLGGAALARTRRKA